MPDANSEKKAGAFLNLAAQQELIKAALANFAATRSAEQELMLEGREIDPDDELPEWVRFKGSHKELTRRIFESIVREYGTLVPWTVDEVAEIVFDELIPRDRQPLTICEQICARFMATASKIIGTPFIFGIGAITPGLNASSVSPDEKQTIWASRVSEFNYAIIQSPSGKANFALEPRERFEVDWDEFVWERQATIHYSSLINLCAVVETNCPPRSASRFASEMQFLLPSIASSYALAYWQDNRSLHSAFLPKKSIIPVHDDSGRLDHQFRRFVRLCLDAYFSEQAVRKSESYNRRLRVALILLAQADQSHDSAIALALSVSALEALLGTSKEGIAEQLAQSVAALLEPDVQQRIFAERLVKDLYSMRSKMVHGERLERSSSKVEIARLLSAAVLKAVTDRIEFQTRMGDRTETPSELLSEIRLRKYRKGQPNGIQGPDLSYLWRTWDPSCGRLDDQ